MQCICRASNELNGQPFRTSANVTFATSTYARKRPQLDVILSDDTYYLSLENCIRSYENASTWVWRLTDGTCTTKLNVQVCFTPRWCHFHDSKPDADNESSDCKRYNSWLFLFNHHEFRRVSHGRNCTTVNTAVDIYRTMYNWSNYYLQHVVSSYAFSVRLLNLSYCISWKRFLEIMSHIYVVLGCWCKYLRAKPSSTVNYCVTIE